jgi:hypothetical protein
VAFQRPDGSIVVVDLDKSVGARVVAKVPRTYCIAWQPDGARLAIACRTSAQVLDLKKGESVWQTALADLSWRHVAVIRPRVVREASAATAAVVWVAACIVIPARF